MPATAGWLRSEVDTDTIAKVAARARGKLRMISSRRRTVSMG